MSYQTKDLVERFGIFLFLLFLPPSCKNSRQFAASTDYQVQVSRIIDGDTFEGVSGKDGILLKFRIYAIDAPEKKQDFGMEAKQYLAKLIHKKTVRIKVQKEFDKYGRKVVWVYTPDGKDVSGEMIRAGMVWHYKQFDPDNCCRYAELERQARNGKVGLWGGRNPQAPWKYRDQDKEH